MEEGLRSADESHWIEAIKYELKQVENHRQGVQSSMEDYRL